MGERRADLLSASFVLFSLISYLRYCSEPDRARRHRLYAVALGLYGLSLLAKPVALGFPLVLLALDVYPLRRFGLERGVWFSQTARRLWLEKLSFLALALAMAPVILMAKRTGSPLDVVGSEGLLAAALVVYAPAFHLWKTLVPLGLSPLYEMPRLIVATGWRFVLAATVVIGFTALLIAKRRRWPAALTAWICYLAILAPTSGIVPYGLQRAADRYTYLACLGWAFLAGAGALYLRRRFVGGGIEALARWGAVAVALATLAAYGSLTWRQNRVWQDSERLWSHTVSVEPDAMYAHSNLGFVYADQGRLEEAAASFGEAVRLDQRNAAFRVTLAHTLVALGRYEEALYHLDAAAPRMDDKAQSYNEIGADLLARGELDRARELFEKALLDAPDRAEPHNNLGVIFIRQGKAAEAVQHFRQAIAISPDYAEAVNNLAGALLNLGQAEEALALYSRALEHDESSTFIRLNLADALASLRRFDEAAAQYRLVLERQPGDARAHNNLGAILSLQGRPQDAAPHFQRALEIDPAFEGARVNLEDATRTHSRSASAVAAAGGEDVEAALMASGLDALTKSDPLHAAALFRQVLALNPSHYGATYQLATALDRVGSHAESRGLWEKVLVMAEGYRDETTAQTARSRLGDGRQPPTSDG